MGRPEPHRRVLYLMAAFSRDPAALAWSQARAEAEWGPLALASPVFDFVETPYYEPTMGTDLKKVLWAFEQPMAPEDLPQRKLQTNLWEDAYQSQASGSESRPLNLDPGYLTQAKFILATTKDRDHRIYLRDGIFAEITLFYRAGRWQTREWTYPDYQRPDYQQFLSECREYYRTVVLPQL